jgi:hypothetical protein
MKTDLTDLKRPKPKKSTGKDAPEIVSHDYYDKYPYGLRLSLCDEELEKLGIDAGKLTTGTEITIKATGQITEIRNSKEIRNGKTEKDQRVEIQIQKLSLADDGNFDDGFKEDGEED